MAPRFVPGSFVYNGRVAAALVPSLVVLMGHAGRSFTALLLIGAMVVYILDTVGYREGAFSATWLLVSAAQLVVLIGGVVAAPEVPILMAVLLVLLYAAALFLTGTWATLQFKWIHLHYPAVSLALEKLLLCGCMPLGVMALTFGACDAVGAEQASWYLLVAAVALYHVCCTPLRSSFYPKDTDSRQHSGFTTTPGGANLPEDVRIQNRMDGLLAGLLCIFLPSSFYAVSHALQLFDGLQHAFAIALLFSAPLLYLCILPTGLWWLAPHGRTEASRAVRRVLGGIALLGAVAGFEGRIVFPGFGQYIPLHPPWNWVMVTVSLYTCVLIAALYAGGSLGGTPGNPPGVAPAVLLLAGVGLGSVAFGLPLWVLPAPLVATSGLLMYVESRMLRDYVIMVLASLAAASWFVWHHFWFLDIDLAGMSLRTLCVLALVAMLPAMLLPGIVLTGTRAKALAPMLFAQACIIAALEEHLFAGEHDEGSSEMYPAYLLVSTSVVGGLAARWLHRHGYLGYYGCWGLLCVYTSKLAVLLVPEARLLFPVLLLILAGSLPVAVAEHRHHHSESRVSPVSGLPSGRVRVPVAQGVLMALLVCMAVLLARFAIFDVVRWAMEGRPSESLLVGVLLLCCAAGCAPLARRVFPHVASVQRALVLAISCGLLLVLLRPPLPIQGGGKCPKLPVGLCPRLWDERHMPMHEAEDMAMWGETGGPREHWGVWFLVLAVLLGLGAATRSRVEMKATRLRRVLLALCAGLSVGAYVSYEFFKGQFPLQGTMVYASLLVALFLVLLQLPMTASPAWLPALLPLWATSIPAALFLSALLPLPPLPEESSRLLAEGLRVVQEERRLANRCAVLMVYAAQATMLALALKLNIARGQGPSDGASNGHVSMPSWASLPSWDLSRGLAPGALQGLKKTLSALEGRSWLPTACNATTLLAFTIALYLATVLSDAPYVAIFLLAPLLLLLCYDPVTQYYVGDAQRYFPPAASVTCYLVCYCIGDVVRGWLATTRESGHAAGATFLVKNSILLTVPVPTHLLFLVFLWRHHAKSLGVLHVTLLTPLNAFALWATDLQCIKVMAGAGLAMGLLQTFASGHKKRLGNRIM